MKGLRKTISCLLFGLILSLCAVADAFALQYARPSSTISTGGFLPVGASPLHETVNEVTANGATDYITSLTTNDVAHLGLSGVIDPNSSAGHILRVQAWGDDQGSQTYVIGLYQNSGNTLIATFPVTIAARRVWTNFSVTLSAAQADSITLYSNLSVRVTNNTINNRELWVTWIELEIPEPVVATAPTVTSPTFTNVTSTTATLGGNVTSDGGSTVTSRGVQWSTTPGGPYTSVSAAAGGTGTFTVPVTGLPVGTLIYFRAWATNVQGTGYSAESSFTTLPVVSNPTFASVTATTATLGGTVTATAAISNKGVEWGTAPGSYPNSVATGTGGSGLFTVPVTGLPAGTLIYFRAWATNVQGTGYSAESSFTTLPGVSNPTFASVTSTTATLGGTVTATAAISNKGVEWGTAPGSYPNSVATGSGGSGPFTVPVTGLPVGTLIYFRAWATNVQGAGYSAESSFTTLPVVSDPTFTSVTSTTATLGGTVTATAAISNKGVEWGTAPGSYPNSVATGTGGTGLFTVPVTGLPAGTLIYFRAWATNVQGTGYSAESSFTTQAGVPTVNTPTFADVTQTSATLGGNVASNGGSAITDRGAQWSTTSGGPYTSVSAGPGGTGPFTVPVSGLPLNTLIYFRAWASNSAGTGYSSESSFTTLSNVTAPTVTAPTFTSITATTATLGGNVTSDGNATITERGTVWALVANPDIATGSKTVVTGTTGIFTGPVTGLNSGTQIHFRAYATNSAGTGYSPNASFHTEPANSPATVTIDTVTASGFRITWPAPGAGNGSGTLVVIRAASAITATPTDGVEHAFSAAFGSGADLGTQQYVVYRGTATQVTVTGLAATTAYHVAAFYYAGTGAGASGINYRQTTPAVNNATTGAVSLEPTVQVTSLRADQVASRAMRLRWTKGNGNGTIVTMRAQATPASPPVDFTDYAADPDYTLAPETSPGSGNFVVYKGTGTLVSVSGLVSNNTYVITAYAWGGFTTSTDYLLSNAPVITQATNGPAMHNLDNAAACGDCHSNHGNSGLVPRGASQEDICRTCHQATGPASAKLEFALHTTPNYGDVNPDCGSCHEVHAHSVTNTTLSVHPVTLQTLNNQSFVRANVDKYITTATSADAVYHTPGNDLAIEGGDATTSRGICQACHTLTDYHKNNSAVPASQCHRGGTADNCDATQVNCTSCHTHSGNFAPQGGSCTGCHSSIQGGGPPTGRREIVSEFSKLSHHVAGTLSDADCEVCHAQSGSGTTTHAHQDGQVTLWNVDNHSANAIQLGNHANPATNSTEAAKLSQFCLNCHDSNGAAAEGAKALAPFTGSGAPPNITTTWSGSSHAAVSQRVPPNGTGNPTSCFGDGQFGCHGSGHGSAKLTLLAPPATAATSPNFSEQREGFCLNCHDSNGPSSIDINALLNLSGTQYTAGATYTKVNKKHDILPADQTYSGAVITCKNCHSPHRDSNSLPVANPNTRAPLATYAKTSSYVGDAISFTYDSGSGTNLDPTNPAGGSVATGWPTNGPYPEPDYIEFCLACHDGVAPPGVTLPPSATNMLNMATTYRLDDQHGRLAGNGSASRGYLKQPWATLAQYNAGSQPSGPYAALNCTLCHGAHGSGNIYNLRTSINVAGQAMKVGSISGFPTPVSTTYTLPAQEQFAWGAWCTFCHEPSHDTNDGTGCQSGHRHGGGNF